MSSHNVGFQARCRGYLLRRELRCVQAEYEDIVRELDGGVEHLVWRGKLIPKPHFSDAETDSDFFEYPRPKIQTQECPEEVKVPDETPCLHSQVPEKDKETSRGPERDCIDTNTPPEGDKELDGVTETPAQALHLSNISMSNSKLQHVPPMHTLLKDVPHTPESLKQHRNNLVMELLWIQQAIASRKKYLTLKQKIETS
ncbi:IQ domain-containing protein C isoform X2 [Tachysurus fulvidraco]|uniref:IQ domain-containing protein C isoform X2 n=1 Tax=Tachysurus fulvidraco TaxID=1234273 RepID=UPI001FEF7291|nr:IQ domain-containing protein C isoform X2 [Tachysurus fulvidraco]